MQHSLWRCGASAYGGYGGYSALHIYLASDPGMSRKRNHSGRNRSFRLVSKMARSSDSSQCKIRVKCAKRAARAEIARKKGGRTGKMGGPVVCEYVVKFS